MLVNTVHLGVIIVVSMNLDVILCGTEAARVCVELFCISPLNSEQAVVRSDVIIA